MGRLNRFGYPDRRSDAEYESDRGAYADLVRRRQEQARRERAASVATIVSTILGIMLAAGAALALIFFPSDPSKWKRAEDQRCIDLGFVRRTA